MGHGFDSFSWVRYIQICRRDLQKSVICYFLVLVKLTRNTQAFLISETRRVERCMLLGRIAVLRTSMRPTAIDRVAWSVTLVSPAKTAEPIEMPFGLRTRVGPGNHALDGGADVPTGRRTFRGVSDPSQSTGFRGIR